jgi:cytochrome c-type biogenesis protein CcmF
VIPEAGLAALWLAAALAVLQFVLAFFGLVEGGAPELTRAVRPVAVVQAVLVALALTLLIMCFLNSDMSVKLVYTESHSAKPFIYKFAGTWGNHEGSMLLWVAILGVAGAAVALFERSLDHATHIATLGAQAVISFGFYAFLLFSSNPFARLDPAPPEGLGLNPLLQDPGLAFHPPTLYVGYVGMSVAFSFAVGALVTRKVDPAFARAMRPWVLGAWIFLTLGITAGSYWAYYVLGWGGWWFWDPVENASLMPWLAATALLHSVTVLATRDGLRAWTVMLAVVAFSMSMVGTFLVRSGILTSVHAFAVDPQRGKFILALLVIYIGGALALFALRVGSVREGARFDAVSREGALVLNNLLLSTILGVVLIGTLYPLIVEAVAGEKLSVGPPFFNATAGPLALLLVIVMAAGPVMRWRRENGMAVVRRLVVPIIIGVVALLAVIIAAPGLALLPLLGLVLAIGVGSASLAPLWGRNLRRTPLFTYGMVLAHLGCAVSLAGMACDSAFLKETLVAAKIGDTNRVGPFAVKFAGVDPIAGPNWTALEATMAATRMGWSGDPLTLTPQLRMYSAPATETTQSAIATLWDGQLYLVLGKQQDDGRWQLRMWWKPFVTLIWAGGAMIAIGGALALLGRVWRGKVRSRRSMDGMHEAAL